MPATPARVLHAVATAGGRSLVQVVAALLGEAFPELPLSNADARRLVVVGAARLNGRTSTRPGASVAVGDKVTVVADPARLARTRRAPPAGVAVLYEDEHLIAVDKPADLPTHTTADPRRPHLVGVVARQCGVPDSALGIHQRLDAGTSGVVVFGRTPEANRGLAQAFEDRLVHKSYLAVLDASRRPDLVVGSEWTSRGALAAAGAGRRGRRVEVSERGQPAETTFVVRVRKGNRAVVEARPKTGRQHQIRAHLAAERVPILGDTRYGGPPAERLHLHAWRLRLPHPVSGHPISVEAAAPEGWLQGS